MADESEENDIKIFKNSKILVNIEEALDDVILVSFTHQSKVFQGALLNSTKKGLPCGIIPPKDFLQPPPVPTSSLLNSPRAEDPPVSPSNLTQRYTYFQETGRENKSPLIHIHRRPIKPPSRYRKPNSKMTVRLRPRQVLCSKCRSICTENSENVDISTRSSRRNPSPDNKNRKILNTSNNTEISETSKNDKSEVDDSKKLNKIKIVGNYWISPTRDEDDKITEIDEKCKNEVDKNNVSDDDMTEEFGKENTNDLVDDPERMVLRKKRSVGSMEDLWDESVFEDNKKTKLELEPRTTTPVIKISFGTSGQVLKIPAKIQNSIDDINKDENKYHNNDIINGNKAAKKALKKAKKETRRKMLGSPTSNLDLPRRHKKHRKKHKESKHRDDSEERWNVAKTDEDYTAIKEQCLKQRLSISLKRLNANAYKAKNDESTTSNSCSPDSSSEEVPDFPESAILNVSDRSTESNSSLLMKISTQSVQTCTTADGRKMNVGDVVWGKIHGFPWWPGKVLSISVSRKDDGVCLAPHAHVAWYGSSTSSLMPCDQLCPFLETFKTRYNKKKRGPYKEAIRQATTEAHLVAVPSASPTQILSVTSSPREVNVVS